MGKRVNYDVPNATSSHCCCFVSLSLSLFLLQLRNCVKVEVAVLGSQSIINLTASVDVKPTKEEEALVYDILPPRRKVPESEAWSVISTLSECADSAVGQLRGDKDIPPSVA